MKLIYLPPLILIVIALALSMAQKERWAQQPATKRFIQENIPLDEIFREWDQKSLRGLRYICSCTLTKCNSDQSWPFRSFQKGESVPVLGTTNKDYAIDRGFTRCVTARGEE